MKIDHQGKQHQEEPVLSKFNSKNECKHVTHHSDVEYLLKSDFMTVEYPFRASRQVFGKTMLDSDSYSSLKIKKSLSRFFSKGAIQIYVEEIVRPIVQDCINNLINLGDEINYFDTISKRIPTQVILKIFGIDLKHEPYIYERLEKLVLYIDNQSNSLEQAENSKNDLLDFLDQCFKEPSSVNSKGIIARLDKTVYQDKDEMLGSCLMLLTAGMATTIAAFGSIIIYSYKYKDHLINLKGDVLGYKKFVGEVLRIAPPLTETVRFVKGGFQYNGSAFKRNELVRIGLAEANRDSSKFCPALDIDTSKKKARNNYSFGKGRHACIGAELAISELHIFLEEFVTHMSDYDIHYTHPEDESEGKIIGMFKNIKLNRVH